jgi:amino acid adenylation domain-containing protein
MSQNKVRTDTLSAGHGAELWTAVRSVLTSQREGPALVSVSREAALPASFAQRRIWLVERLTSGIPLHNLTVCLRMEGSLSIRCLQQSLSEMLRRHDILRTTLRLVGGELIQDIRHCQGITMAVVDLRRIDGSNRYDQAKREAEAEAQTPFDLQEPPLLRARLLRLADQEHHLLLTVHHLAFDGSSFGPFISELCAIYRALIEDGPLPSPPQLQYADFANWQRRRFDPDALAPLIRYWKQRLGGSLPVLHLPSDRPRGRVRTYRGACIPLEISKTRSEAVKRLCVVEEVTPFMMLLAVLQTLLHRYTAENDVIVGSPIASRNRAEIQNMLGIFVNTLALRTRIEGHMTFQELLARVREVVLGAYQHQDLPFDMLVEALAVPREANTTPVFQVVFAYQNVPAPEWTFLGLTVNAGNIHNGTAQFELTLVMWETDDGFRGSLEYDTDLFDPETIAQFARSFGFVLEAVTQNPDQCLARVPLLSEGERRRIVEEFNQTAQEYPRDQTIHRLFETQAQQTPEATALAFEHGAITYRELETRANRIARYLAHAGVQPGARVGVCLERSPELIVSLLAILKVGAAFVPIDPASPTPYIALVVEAGDVCAIVTERAMERRILAAKARVLFLEEIHEDIERASPEPFEAEVDSDGLAYVMYTSGSTGRPKGVCITHRGVARLVKEANYASLTPEDIFLQLSPASFDASTFEIWGSLLNGATLALPGKGPLSAQEITDAIRHHHISILFLTPVLFELIVDTCIEGLASVRQLLVGGDVLSPAHAERFMRQAGHCRLINCYGPTENTTFTTFHPVRFADCVAGHSIPIGRPVSNTTVYVLDALQQPVPSGVVGEAYIGGDGVMKGYLGDPQFTREYIYPDPFSDERDAFLYRTGDLVRLRRDGELEFIGRMDDQVKIRGFRVEPGEVEAVLCRCTEVKAAAVVVREFQAGKRLIAYVIPRSPGQQPAEIIARIRGFGRERLPRYMCPSEFVLLDAFPMSANGKLNRASLPLSPPQGTTNDGEAMASTNEIERRLLEIFERILRVRPVGLQDNFFDRGGDSLMAMQLLVLLEEAFDKALPLVSLFEHPTVAELSVLFGDWKRKESPDPVLVEMRSGGSEMPLFFVPGGLGGMAELALYAGLMQHLDGDHSVYGLLAQGLRREDTPQRTLPERAAAFVGKIRSVQPRGPYALGGECAGGIVAFEMAQQLVAQGQEVALLLLMDTWRPVQSDSLRARYFYKPIEILKNRGSAARAGVFILLRMLRTFVREQPASDLGSWASYWCSIIRRLGRKTVLWRTAIQNIEQTMRYQPQPYPGEISLLITSHSDREGLVKGWQSLSDRELNVYLVPGDHWSYIRETTGMTAQQLQVCLDKSAGERHRSIT